jgi:hypothetical protein
MVCVTACVTVCVTACVMVCVTVCFDHLVHYLKLLHYNAVAVFSDGWFMGHCCSVA